MRKFEKSEGIVNKNQKNATKYSTHFEKECDIIQSRIKIILRGI